MARLGVLLAVLGFGSAVLHYTSIQFRLLTWSEPMQPGLGIALGAVGALIAAVPHLRNRSRQGEASPVVAVHPGQPYAPPAQQVGQQPYGTPAQFPPQPYQQQAQFPPHGQVPPAQPQQFGPQPGHGVPGGAPGGSFGPQGGQSFGSHR